MEDSSGDSGKGFSVALWLPAGIAPPPPLVQALTSKRVKIDRAASPFAALASLCRASRASRQARTASGHFLIVVYPEQQPDARAVLDAAAKFAPGMRCWMYGPAANPKLRAIVESDMEQWGGPEREPEIVIRPRPSEVEARPIPIKPKPAATVPPADYRTQTTGKPPLRLAGQGTFDLPPEPVDVDKKGPEEGAAGLARSQVLTPEELRMLLGEDGPDVAGQR